MKKHLLILFFIFGLINLSKAQILVDNFADGDFTQNPIWTPVPNNTDFVIQNNRLRSNSPTLNSSFFIATPLTISGGLTWEMDIEMQINPSGTNYVDIFLQSNSSNLTDVNTEGYFVRVGNTDDEISLYKRKNGINTEIIDGINGILNNSTNIFKIKITRNLNNEWILERNIANNWTTEGTILDNEIPTGSFFGILVRQSIASFINKHFFDNIVIDQFPENIPPVWQSLKVIDDKNLELTFSEALNVSTIQNLANYTVLPTNIPISSVNIPNPNVVVLTFQTSFTSLQNYELLVANLTDLSGNVIISSQKLFVWTQTFLPKFHELVVSEIMIDARGSAQPLNPLPNREYIEIYNRTPRILNLKNCKLIDDGIYTMPEVWLYPQEYALLVKNSDTTLFQNFGKVIGLTSFPNLVNTGDTIFLKNAQNELLFSIIYSDKYHENSAKKDGGWSLEMVDVNNPCSIGNNWTSSVHLRGGTPAKKNSIQDYRPDFTKPTFLRAEATNENNVILTFDENLAQNTPQNINIQIFPLINIAQKTWLFSDNFSQLKLELAQPLTTDKYEIEVDFFADCAGNINQQKIKKIIGKPQKSDSSNIIVNEILFNPTPNNVDFVELYNRSEKFIDLKNYLIANQENNIYTNQKTITNNFLIMPPKSYLVLTTDKQILKSNYPNIDIENVFECDLPSLTDNEGTFVLINSEGKVIENMYYNEDWHFELLDNKEGVSLERIGFDVSTQNKNSWKSASANVNFATPTFKNSQQINDINIDNQFQISPQTFTPDQDGYQDFTTITLKNMPNNAVVSIYIYDRNGREIKRIAQNSIIGTDNFFVWDGTKEQGERVTDSNYLVVAKVFTANGGEQIFRKPVVVGSRF